MIVNLISSKYNALQNNEYDYTKWSKNPLKITNQKKLS